LVAVYPNGKSATFFIFKTYSEEILRKFQLSKGIVRRIIKVEKEGNVFEYKGAGTPK
jgi:hypothetical protein